jgi:hypothetical protein
MNLSLPQHLEYITKTENNTQYVRMPLKEWEDFLLQVKHQAEMQAMREQLKEGFAELKSIREGKTKGIPIEELLAEL